MISLGTLRGLHDHDHQLHAYCPKCARWVELNLAHLIARGMGYKAVPFRVRCLRCGERGVAQLRPPLPKHSVANGWIMPTVVPLPRTVDVFDEIVRVAEVGRTDGVESRNNLI